MLCFKACNKVISERDQNSTVVDPSGHNDIICILLEVSFIVSVHIYLYRFGAHCIPQPDFNFKFKEARTVLEK